jgi:hypothetical protein
VRLARLHPLGRDSPLRPLPVHFRPGGADELALANTGQQHETNSQPQRRRGTGLLKPIEQDLDLVAAEVALTRDEGRVGLAGERFGRVVDLYALPSGEPVDLQNQFPGVYGRPGSSFALHAVEQFTQRDRLDLVEIQLRERARQDAGVDRAPQRQRAVGEPLGATLGVGLELEVPRRPPPEAHGFGDLAALLDLGPRRRAP